MADETFARLNIEHLRNLLATERDEGKRKVLQQRLDEEEQKLAEALRRKRRNDGRFASQLVVSPVPPVRRSDVDFLPSARFQPACLRASARKNKGMRAVVVYHRQFEIAVERCGHYPLPIH